MPRPSHACFIRRISEYEQWKTRKLNERYVYAFADGTYFTVIYNGEGCKMPILAVVGIAETGERDVLADHAWAIAKMNKPGKICWMISKREASRRLICGKVDGNQAMLNALTKKFPDSARQRCVVHKMDNVREPRAH